MAMFRRKIIMAGATALLAAGIQPMASAQSLDFPVTQVPIQNENGSGVVVYEYPTEGEASTLGRPDNREVAPMNEPVRDYYFTEHPSAGGTWQYGKVTGHYSSNYFHSARCHGSTVQTANKRDRVTGVNPGYWSRASVSTFLSFGTAEYYHHTC